MPQITVWCLPPDLSEKALRGLHQYIVMAAVSVKELQLKGEQDLLVVFPPDMMKYGAGTEIMVQVSELWDKPERTPEVRNRLARVLGEGIKDLFPDAVVAVRLDPPFRPAEHGFWTSTGSPIAPTKPAEIVALRITPQCRSKFAGEWLHPAQLTESERDEILDRLPINPARDLHNLLVEHGNQIGHRLTSTSGMRAISQALKKPVGEKYYRLASGTTNNSGRYQSQLWEVQPVPK